MLNDILEGPIFQTEIYNGQTLADFLSLEFIASVLGSILSAILIIIAGFIVAGWVSRRIKGIAGRHRSLDVTLFEFLAQIARYVIIAFTILFVLNTFGVRTTSIVAAIGAAGLAIGLALQGTLSNVAAGIMIIFFRPFKQGDFVQVNDKMGTVKAITINYTELANIGNVQVIIPNSEVWGNTITNYSAYPKRRAEWTFGVGYGANLAEAQRIILDTIMADERSQSDPEPFIQVNNLGDSSVDFLVRVWCDASVYFVYQADMKRRVKEALDAGGVPIPFPTRTIHQVAS
ncbi:MAG: mechanosensitive ion channel domain-containing protein [Pseudomonadota bacterium]